MKTCSFEATAGSRIQRHSTYDISLSMCAFICVIYVYKYVCECVYLSGCVFDSLSLFLSVCLSLFRARSAYLLNQFPHRTQFIDLFLLWAEAFTYQFLNRCVCRPPCQRVIYDITASYADFASDFMEQVMNKRRNMSEEQYLR